ncbi:MAG: Acetoin:2,6-dichlorophenolindophenol oxidoreductase subunit alpha [Chlamydiae bacterium]|nr:Acetoin:2,6-dichlorophenolindophenol oxidoreductase subunit alpha [Chlamydiota bacterium]
MKSKKQALANTCLDCSNEPFYRMLRIRMVEEAIANRYPEQKMRCPVHLSIGQEAIAVGVCDQLQQTDYVVSNHRAHAHYLAKGGSLKRMIAEIYGKEGGCSKGRGGSMHLIDLEAGFMGSTPIVGGTFPIGVGIAFGSALEGKKQVTAIFFGEGATEEGVFAESLNFAALKNLSVLFVCENNLYSVYSPLSVRQPLNRSRVDIAKAHGIFSLEGDGNNLEEVLSLTEQGVSHIREGNGPCFLEFDTYRHREHCGPNLDNQLGYRTEEEFEYWLKRDPLKDIHVDQAIKDQIEREIEEAFIFAEKSPYPTYEEGGVYA